jgi:hypothetical protein
MIVKILSRERDAVEKVLAMVEIKANFYTMEKNPNMMQFELNAPPETIWYIARCVQAEVNCEDKPYSI